MLSAPGPVAVVGAGVAGLALAGALRAAGRGCVLFDKGRAPGGRLAARRAALPNGAAVAFDHGCAFLRAPAEGSLAALLGPALAAGALAPWDAGLADRRPVARLAGAPGMSALPRALAAGLDLRLGAPVTAVRREAEGWHLRVGAAEEGGAEEGPFAALVLALPAPQAVALLATAGPGGAPARLAAALRGARYAPCWTLMAAHAAPLALPDALRPAQGPIAFAAREGAKPGRRRGGPDLWVAHAAAEWSRERLEDEPGAVRAALLDALGTLAGGAPAPLHAVAHRWRFALVERAAGDAPLWDACAALGACGDALAGPRAGQAMGSGLALAALMTG